MNTSSSASVPDAPASSRPKGSRVLIFTGVFPPEIGGAGMVPQAIATAFPDRVAIVTQRHSPEAPPITDWAAFDAQFPFKTFRIERFYSSVRWRPGKLRGILILLYNALWIRPKAWLELRRLLASHPFDVACLNTIGTCYWLPRALRWLNPQLKVIVYSHGEEWSGMKSTDWGRRMFRTIQKADANVAVSSYTCGRAITEGIPATGVHLVNNGVDLNRFSPGPRHPELLDRWNLHGRPIILCLARLDERKGQDAMIRAMPVILQSVPQAVLLLVGGGTDGPRLQALVEELQLQASVIFTGSVSAEEVVAWYRTADLYAMPNRTTDSGDTEGFGLVFLEAGACGLPVIGGRAGGVPDAVLDGETGFLIDGRAPAEIAAACTRLLLDPELRATMGRNGLAHAARNSWPQQAAKFLAICDATVYGSAPLPSTPDCETAQPLPR